LTLVTNGTLHRQLLGQVVTPDLVAAGNRAVKCHDQLKCAGKAFQEDRWLQETKDISKMLQRLQKQQQAGGRS